MDRIHEDIFFSKAVLGWEDGSFPTIGTSLNGPTSASPRTVPFSHYDKGMPSSEASQHISFLCTVM